MESSLTSQQPPEKEKPATDVFVCTNCGTILFDADKKFEAGCGFPSFWLHHGNNVRQKPLHTYGRSRIQLLCNHCGAHLGHLFSNKQTPNGLRYCINANAIQRMDKTG